MQQLLAGITFTVTITIGAYVLSLSHSTGGETRVSHGVAAGRIQRIKALCINGCEPGSKVEDVVALDMSPPQGIALVANRSGGEVTLDAGLHTSLSSRKGLVAVDVSATTTLSRQDAARLLRSPNVKPYVPEWVNGIVRGNEVRNNAPLSSLAKPAIPFYSSDPTLKAWRDLATRKPAFRTTVASTTWPIDTGTKPSLSSGW